MTAANLALPALARKPMTPDYNVLLIVLDDVGVEWFSSYAIGERYCTDPTFQYARTPVMEALRLNGLQFMEAYANPVCGPTRACLQTGKYAFRTGFGENIRDPTTATLPGNRLPDSLPWLPRAIHLARPGVYDTGTIGKWHLCDGFSSTVPAGQPYPPPNANLDHANAVGYDYSAIHIPNYGCAFAWHRIVNGVVQPSGGFTSPPFDTTNWSPCVNLADAAAWIASRTRPWYLHLAFNPPHVPLAVPPFETLSPATITELQQAGLSPGMPFPVEAGYSTIKLVWRAANESVDYCIGQLLAGMTPAVRANTMVIVLGDNGTVANAIPPGFPHTKRDVYRGGSQVPMVVQGPMVVEPGRAPTALVHAVDVYATVLDIVSSRPPPTISDCDGISFLPVILNQPGKRKRIFIETFGPWGAMDPQQQVNIQRSLFDGRWRYVLRQGQFQLFDNDVDFLEVNDLLASNLDIGSRFARELDEITGS
jgi:arylsulfatase A-like enzyme